jgi:hypothetical protein
MTIYQDALTKGLLTAWLADLPDDTVIALEINESAQLDFIITDVNGQDRILRVGVFGPYDDEQADPETNDTN